MIKKIQKFQNDVYYALNNINDFKQQKKYLKKIYSNLEIKDCCFVLPNIAQVRIR